MDNSYKIRPENASRGGIFSKLKLPLFFERLFENGLPVAVLPKAMFVTFLLVLYIGNNHYAERMIRNINELEVEVEDLRADFTTLKSDYMFSSKQSEVAKRMASKGLVESVEPPKKIIITE